MPTIEPQRVVPNALHSLIHYAATHSTRLANEAHLSGPDDDEMQDLKDSGIHFLCVLRNSTSTNILPPWLRPLHMKSFDPLALSPAQKYPVKTSILILRNIHAALFCGDKSSGSSTLLICV